LIPLIEFWISDTDDNPVPGESWALTLLITAGDLAPDTVALAAADDATASLAAAGDG
jgi:hypothetical protein